MSMGEVLSIIIVSVCFLAIFVLFWLALKAKRFHDSQTLAHRKAINNMPSQLHLSYIKSLNRARLFVSLEEYIEQSKINAAVSKDVSVKLEKIANNLKEDICENADADCDFCNDERGGRHG